MNGLLRWAAGDEGVEVVVFGDSWVDDTRVQVEDGRGQSWAEYWCEMVRLHASIIAPRNVILIFEKMDCSASLSFAISRPSDPISPPMSALVSNEIYIMNASTLPNPAPATQSTYLLPISPLKFEST